LFDICKNGFETTPKVGQATKGLWWIPRHTEAMKDVVTDDMLWGVGSKH
jgi:hypothetical protein